jgi:hypothetical protein
VNEVIHSITYENNLQVLFLLDIITPLPMSPSDSHNLRSSSVVYIRSLSNKTTFDTPDDFYRQMRQTEVVTPYSPTLLHRRRSASSESGIVQHFSSSSHIFSWN